MDPRSMITLQKIRTTMQELIDSCTFFSPKSNANPFLVNGLICNMFFACNFFMLLSTLIRKSYKKIHVRVVLKKYPFIQKCLFNMLFYKTKI